MSRTFPFTLLALSGCMSFDPFTFNPTRVDAYEFSTEVIPASLIQQVTFEGADGQELWGIWATQDEDGVRHPDAPGFALPAVPFIATFHGNSGHLADGDNWERVEALWSAGFSVFTFDYSGYGRSEGQPTFEVVQDDARSAIAHVEEWIAANANPAITWDRVPLHGLSLGGGIAVHIADEYPPLALMTEDTFASYEAVLEQTTGGIGIPAGWMFEEAFDTEKEITKVDSPVLVMHSKDDSFIPAESGQLLYEAANEPKSLWLVPGSDHADIPATDPDGFAAKITEHVANAETLRVTPTQ